MTDPSRPATGYPVHPLMATHHLLLHLTPITTTQTTTPIKPRHRNLPHAPPSSAASAPPCSPSSSSSAPSSSSFGSSSAHASPPSRLIPSLFPPSTPHPPRSLVRGMPASPSQIREAYCEFGLIAPKLVGGINGDRERGSVKFNVQVLAIVRFKYGGWRARRRFLRVFCDDLAVGIKSNGSNGTLSGVPYRCAIGI